MNYGWISQTGDFAKRPLLGKPCAEYVLAAMREVVQVDGVENLSTRRADVALCVREDAVCLTPATLRGLLRAGEEQPSVLLSLDTELPLALALRGDALENALSGDRPTVEDLVSRLSLQKASMRVWSDERAADYIAVNDAKRYAEALQTLNLQNIEKRQLAGVIILDPARTIIESDVIIGAGTIVYPGNVLQGGTRVGANCVLYQNNRMDCAVVGDGTTVESSVLLHCQVGCDTTVGPYAYIRPDTKIGDGCRIGDFVEVKNSTIGDATKISHLTYVGDSDLGKDINLGCGVVFVNYDGKVKRRSTVDDHAFIGCNCNLVAPVHVGKNAYLAAGSTVVEDVPEDALFVARSRGVTKEEWVKRRKEAGKL